MYGVAWMIQCQEQCVIKLQVCFRAVRDNWIAQWSEKLQIYTGKSWGGWALQRGQKELKCP